MYSGFFWGAESSHEMRMQFKKKKKDTDLERFTREGIGEKPKRRSKRDIGGQSGKEIEKERKKNSHSLKED